MALRETKVAVTIKVFLLSYNQNDILWKASFQNISLLAEAFHVKISTFKKKSSFYLLPYSLLQDEAFLQRFKKELSLYFSLSENVPLISTYKTDKELASLAKSHKQLIYLPDFALVKISRKNPLSIFEKRRNWSSYKKCDGGENTIAKIGDRFCIFLSIRFLVPFGTKNGLLLFALNNAYQF